jgi:phage terminase large subunit-like protein
LTRVSLQLEKLAKRQLFLPRAADWLVDFENEIFAFPNGRYDDQVDALFQALANERPRYLWDEASLRGLNQLTFGLILSGVRF